MANKLDLAIMQIVGYTHGKQGYSMKILIESMGLKKSEYLKIRDKLSNAEKKEIDDLLNIKT